MSNQLEVVRRELAPVMKPIEATLEQLLPPALPPERLLQTLYVSCSQNPKLMQASRQSLIQGAISAAVLGLEVDGVSGQGYLVPFRGMAQFISGYRGMVTLAARSGRTLEGFVVREGDEFEPDEVLGLPNFKRNLGNESERKIVAAFAISRFTQGPPMMRVLSIDQIIERRNRSAGWKAKGQSSTWGTDFEAMTRKTPMRDLSKDLPVLSLHAANALEMQHDLGRHAWLHPDGGVVVNGKEASVEEVATPRPDAEVLSAQPAAADLVGDTGQSGQFVINFAGKHGSVSYDSVERYEGVMLRAIDKITADMRPDLEKANADFIDGYLRREYPDVASRIIDKFESYK